MPTDLRFPLIVGVTGHRDPDPAHLPAVQAALRSLLEWYRAAFPHTPLILASPLATGGDQIAAEQALLAGWRLLAVLPMPLDDYREDFAAGPESDRFAALLARAAAGTVALPRLAGERLDRPAQYAALADWYLHHTHAVVALWDGARNGLAGGTGWVVDRLLAEGSGCVPFPVIGCMVHHIATPRLGSIPAAAPAADAVRHARSGNVWADAPDPAWTGLLAELDRCNRAAPREAECGADRAGLAAGVFAWTDRHALVQQRRHHRLLVVLPALAVAAWLGLAALDLSGDGRWLAAYAAPMAVGGIVVLAAVTLARLPDRFLDRRALAEALRVQAAWWQAGLDEMVERHWMRRLNGPFDWIRLALRSVSGLAQTRPTGAADRAALERVRRDWVQDQARYFAGADGAGGAARRDDHRARVADRSSILLVVLGILTIFASALAFDGDPERMEWGLSLGGLLQVLAAALASWAHLRAFAHHARSYERMAQVFVAHDRCLQRTLAEGRIEEACAALRGLGCEALEESAAWLAAHRDRPLEIPRAG